VLAACLPRQDHVYSTTDQFFRVHNNEFDEMSCKLDSTQNLCRLRNTQPHLKTITKKKKRKRCVRNAMSLLVQISVWSKLFVIFGALVTWAIYTQGQLLL